MAAIFKIYPAVQKKHREYVPHRMTESEFWTRFFQSHYYSVHITSKSENVFAECAKVDDKEWNRDVGSIRDDPLYDLDEIYDGEKLHDTQADLRLGQSSSKANAGNI